MDKIKCNKIVSFQFNLPFKKLTSMLNISSLYCLLKSILTDFKKRKKKREKKAVRLK